MSVARVTEIKASSTKSFDDAIKVGVAHAQKTLNNLRGAWIENQEVVIDANGQITEVSRPDEGNLHPRRLKPDPHLAPACGVRFPEQITSGCCLAARIELTFSI